jgi:hypothetical protein
MGLNGERADRVADALVDTQQLAPARPANASAPILA